jgi:hypothetical protein
MKTNLDNIYKTDSSMEKDGIWFAITDETQFLVRRFGGANAQKVKQATAKYYKPFARQVENGTMSAEKEKEILVRSFVESCLVDWKGVEIDGEEQKFEKEKAIELFCNLPDLFESIYEYATATSSYREDLGNS